MSDLPKSVEIHEEGPREGFQIEPGPIATADKIRLIEALAETGLATSRRAPSSTRNSSPAGPTPTMSSQV